MAPAAEVGASEHEAEVVSGRRGLDPFSNPVLRYLARNARPPRVPVGNVLREGDLVNGFRVVPTPGHTLGHVSLLRDADGLLFTGDAFGVLVRRVRVGGAKFVCTDPPLAKRSAERLLAEEFGTVVMTHGRPLYTGPAGSSKRRSPAATGHERTHRDLGAREDYLEPQFVVSQDLVSLR